jgi:RNA polymerase sigma-70 factor (ECF subfamily)
MRIMPDSGSAADMLQEGFLDIYQKLDRYDGKGSFEGWMKRLMVNSCIDGLRRNKKMPIYFSDNIPETKDHIDTRHEYNIDLLINVVEMLPQGYKMIFSLYAIEGYDHEEIGQILGISEQTSKSQYHRAKIKIRELINELKLKDKIFDNE